MKPNFQESNSNLLARLAIFLVAILIYSPSILYDFTYDDSYQIDQSSYVTSNDSSVRQVFSIFNQATFPGDLYRPITSLSLRLNYLVSDQVPWSYHLVNILLHALVSVFCFTFLCKLGFSRLIAFVTSLIFALNPIHVEAVANIYNRTELLAAFFGLISLITWLDYQKDRSLLKLTISLSSLFIAFLAKESALTLVVIIFILKLYHSPASTLTMKFKESWKSLLAYLLTVVLYLLIRSIILADNFLIQSNLDFYPAENPLLNFNFLERIIPSFFLIGEYVRLSILPLTLSIDYSFPASYFQDLLASPIAISAQLIFAVLLLVLFKFRHQFKESFGLLWFIVTISIACNLVWPIGTFFAERLAYLPSLGLSLFLTTMLFKYTKTRKLACLLAGSYLLLLGLLTYKQLPIWENNISLFSYVSEANSVSAKASYNLGIAHQQQGNYFECSKNLKETLYRDPTYTQAVPDIISCSYYNQEFKSVIYWSKKYLEHDPDNLKVLTFKTLALGKLLKHSKTLSSPAAKP